MKILVVSATQPEIEPFLNHLSKGHKPQHQHQVEVLITGVGMVATAFQLGQKLQNNQNFDLILNMGIAGSFDRDNKLGDVIFIESDTIGELGAETEEGFLSLAELGFGQQVFHANYPDHIKDMSEIKILKKQKGLTVNTVHGNSKSIETITKRFPDIQIESMEGAAVFYVAQKLNIPCIQIRAISNYVESRNKDNWQIPLAIQELNNWIRQFIISKIK